MNPALIASSVLALLDLAQQLRAEAIRTGEWTTEQEEAYQAKTTAAFATSAWKPSGRKSKGR
ncbi:MAG: hypothetical protein U1G08_02435 [Verrucomicrobiota bacterium]